MGTTSEPLAIARELGRRLRAFRTQAGLSQEQLAEVAGLHMTYVSSVERGERNVSLLNIVRLAEAVNQDPAELIRGLRS